MNYNVSMEVRIGRIEDSFITYELTELTNLTVTHSWDKTGQSIICQ